MGMVRHQELYLVAELSSDIGRFALELCALLNISIQQVSSPAETVNEQKKQQVFLWAYSDTTLDVVHDNLVNQQKHIVFGVPSDFQKESEALARGYSGVIHQENAASTLVKALNAIANGELWFSRKALEKFAVTKLNIKPFQTPVCSKSAEKFARLTPKERNIAKSLFAGKTNKEIANIWQISLHTVKAHIYNIYKKLEVGSRTEAMNMAHNIRPLLQDTAAFENLLPTEMLA